MNFRLVKGELSIMQNQTIKKNSDYFPLNTDHTEDVYISSKIFFLQNCLIKVIVKYNVAE